MSMTETQAPKKRGGFSDESRAKAMATRAANRAAKQSVPPPAPPPEPPKTKSSEFAGLSKINCCGECREGHCVISGMWACAHPLKAGLQAAQMSDHKALARFNRAKEFLS